MVEPVGYGRIQILKSLYPRGVGLFEIRTTRPKYSTRRTRVESDPLLEVLNYSNFNRIVRNDRTVRHNRTVRSDRTVQSPIE